MDLKDWWIFQGVTPLGICAKIIGSPKIHRFFSEMPSHHHHRQRATERLHKYLDKYLNFRPLSGEKDLFSIILQITLSTRKHFLLGHLWHIKETILSIFLFFARSQKIFSTINYIHLRCTCENHQKYVFEVENNGISKVGVNQMRNWRKRSRNIYC